MSLDKYLDICEQLGRMPQEESMPLDISDFPPEVYEAIIIFNSLGDRVAADIGYIGKDFSSLPLLIEVHEVNNKELLLDILLWMDRRLIKNSSDKMKEERDKVKRKSNGKSKY